MKSKELKAQLSDINKNQVADEIFWWLKENVVNYIDSHLTSYSLSFLAHEEKMKETAKIEHLCNQIESVKVEMGAKETFQSALERKEVKEEGKMQKYINSFMEEVQELMQEDEVKKNELFKALSEYYTVVGFYKNNPLVKELEGYINIEYLSFENMELEVTKTPLVAVKDEDGNVVNYSKDDSQKELITKMPPAFVIDMSLEFWENKSETSIF